MNRRTKTPRPMSPEQQRLRELSRIASQRVPETSRRGMWFVEQYLPDDLKAEWRALQAATAQQVQTATR
jgi:hypothetical protein